MSKIIVKDSIETKLEDLRLIERDGEYFLRAIFRKTDKETGAVDRITVPRIFLPINISSEPVITSWVSNHGIGLPVNHMNIDLGFGPLDMKPDVNGHYCLIESVVKPVKKMTVKEIEEALGHRVKIVSSSSTSTYSSSSK